ncbi:MAG: hypothetical protein JWM20_582 [Patescibacteria group bacterium]|nr:hypothetical protein [Patescibacteria group bacterium]
MKTSEKNVFFDINKLPGEKGHLVIGLSMTRLEEGQAPEDIMNFLRHVVPAKVSKPFIGCNFLYTDGLYLYSDEPAGILKKKYSSSMTRHKNGLWNAIQKAWFEFQIQNSFSFLVWNQLYIGHHDFYNHVLELKKIYDQDSEFQKYLKLDCKDIGRETSENQIMFFLEESLAMMYIMKGLVRIPNDFILDQEEWILFCYSGRPLRSHIYMHQRNIFGLKNSKNIYENSFYNIEGKELIRFDDVDLETYSVK